MQTFVTILVLLIYFAIGVIFTEMTMGEDTRIYYTSTYVCTVCGWILIIPVILLALTFDVIKRKVHK